MFSSLYSPTALLCVGVIAGCGGREQNQGPADVGVVDTRSPLAAYAFAAGHRATNAAQGFEVSFDEGNATLRRASDWRLRLSLRCIGREARCAPPHALGSVESHENRIEHVRGDVREWYVNGPEGLEQGYVLGARPAGDGALRIEVALDGLVGRTQGDAVRLVDSSGSAVLRVEGLHAFDADGRALVAWMTVDDRGLAMHVDDRAARYPVTVDPLYLADPVKLAASDGLQFDSVGDAVAVNGARQNHSKHYSSRENVPRCNASYERAFAAIERAFAAIAPVCAWPRARWPSPSSSARATAAAPRHPLRSAVTHGLAHATATPRTQPRTVRGRRCDATVRS